MQANNLFHNLKSVHAVHVFISHSIAFNLLCHIYLVIGANSHTCKCSLVIADKKHFLTFPKGLTVS